MTHNELNRTTTLTEREDGANQKVQDGAGGLGVIDTSIPNSDRHSMHEHKPRKRELGIIPIPKSKRHDPALKVHEQFVFTWKMNLILAGAATVSVSNLYYSQPMLVAIANDFGASNEDVSLIPTLAQAGYATGILFISPLGDLVRRRPLVILLVLICSLLSIGLALAKSVAMLQGLTFLIGVTTVTPQICIPWSADLAPSNIRARAMSITLSGLIVGVVQGRLLAGVFATYTSWRDTYWLAVGIQGAMVGGLWLALPDTPDKDIGLSYFGVLWSMVKMFPKYPTLVQVCCCAFFNAMCFAGFWTTTTFLLSDPPYNYTPFNIGLFGLLGLIGALLAPVWGRVVDKIVPWLGQISGSSLCLTSMIIALAAADVNIAGVAIPMALYDCGGQLFQVSSSYRVAGLDAKARARLNGCVLLSMFVGQTSGTAILTKIYNERGWKPTGGTAVGFACAPILFLLLRGPHEERWFGWRGGWELLKRPQMTDLSPEALTEGPLRERKSPGDELKDVAVVHERGDLEALAAGAGTRAGTGTAPKRT